MRILALIFTLSAMNPLLAMHPESDVFVRCQKMLADLGQPFTIKIYGELHDDPNDQARRRSLIQGARHSEALLALEGAQLNTQAHLHIIGDRTAGAPIGTLESGIFGIEDEHSYALGMSVGTLILLTEQIEAMKQSIVKRDIPSLLSEGENYQNLLTQFIAKIANSKPGREAWRASRKSSFAHQAVEAAAADIDRVVASAEKLNGQIRLSEIKFDHKGWGNFEGVLSVFRNYLSSLIQTLRGLQPDKTMASALNLAERILFQGDPAAIQEFTNTILNQMRSEAFARNISEIVIRALQNQKIRVDSIMGEDHAEGVMQILREKLGASALIEFEHSQSSSSRYFDPIKEIRGKLTAEIEALRIQITDAKEEDHAQILQNKLRMTQANLLYFEAMKTLLNRAEAIIGKPASKQFGKAILEAQNIGFGELGLDGANPAANGNYSQDQLERKVVILINAGLSDAQITALFGSKILGIDLP